MSDYPRWDGGPPASGSYPPPRYESGYRDRPDHDRDRRQNESRDVPRYRDDGPVAAPPAARHAVRVDFNDFDRGSYRSPSPLRREPQKTSVSPPRWRQSRSPGPVYPAYTDKWVPRGASPPRDPARRDRSPLRDPVRRDRTPPLDRGGATSWDAYGGGSSSRPPQLQQAGGRLSPIPVSTKRPRSPTPGQDSRYIRRDYPAPAGEQSRYPPVGYSDRGPPPGLDRETDRFREPTELGRRPLSPPRDRFQPSSPPRRQPSPSRYPPRASEPAEWDARQKSLELDRGEASPSIIKTTTATIKEYINSFSGILELSQDPSDRSIPPTVFFHASANWIVNRAGNPYGCPIKYLDVLGSNVVPSEGGVSLEREMPIGSKISVTAKQVDSPFVNYLALQVWPLTTEPPPKDELVSGLIEKKQEHYLREFRNYLLDAKSAHGLVQATFPIFPWMGSGPDSAATVWQIKDENYGVLEVKGTIPEKFRFFALFHRDHVWLKDGKRGMDVEFFKGKPLSEMVRMGQPVTLSARSIVTTSGADLKPSILELQAVIVSLNVGHIPTSAPRPTMCLGGTGAYGMGSKASWYYYQQDLNNSLNRLLVTYLKMYDKNYPDLHPACQIFVEPKRKIDSTVPSIQPGTSETSVGKIPNRLTNAAAKVLEHPSGEFFILENYEHTWRCLVPASRTLSSGGRRSDMELIFPMASSVHINAVLIDEKNPVQYLATLAWSVRDIQPSSADLASQDGQPDRINTELYWKYCKHAAPKQQPIYENSAKPTAIASAIKSSSIYFDGKEATVLKLLDDNFGVLEADRKLVLFDTCDIWLDPLTTADKIGKKLIDVIAVGTVVYFHGALIDDSASIQYLASSVWLKKDVKLFAQKRPMPILKENIHQEKIDIYKLVVQSVGHTMVRPTEKPSNSSQAQVVKEKWDKDIIYSYNGVIKCIFYDSSYSEHQHILGGVIETTESRSLAFFLTKHSLIYSILPSIGAKVKVNLKPIQSRSRWTDQVPFVAISLFQHGDVMENPRDVEKKFEMAKQKMVELVDHPLATRALENLKKGAVAGLIDVTPQGMQSASSSVGLKIHDEVPYSTLKCMINETSGVLENNFDRKSLCYFEIDDLNTESPIDFKDLVKIMTNTEGIRIRYQAKMINDRGSIQYVAHIGGVQIVGQLPHSMGHIKLKEEDYQSDQPVGLRNEKLNRYREAEEKFRRGKVLSVASILDGSYKVKPDHVCARGVVRHVLNENFGLVYGPSDADEADKSYCLFDTFDLYLSVDMTAADAGKSVESVTPAGTEIIYNACFINGDKAVPYLATSLWAANNTKVNPPLPSLPKESIQEDKLNIFVQVADSCAAIISDLDAASRKIEARRSQSRSKDSEYHRGHSESRRSDSRREDIEKVYSAESYKTYVRLMPKHRRGTRDPKTPDRNSSMSSAEWSEKISNFRADVYRWTKKRTESNASGIKDVIAKNDLVDKEVTGTLLKEVNSKFAILQLSNGSKALLGHNRVWLNDKQLFGDWRALKTTFFRKLNVNARKWKGPQGIEYQVTFCHAGMHKVDFKTKNFLYTGAMKTWCNALLNIQQLDAEGADFEAIVGKK